MPINAGPEFGAAERKYHEAKTNDEKMKALENMLRQAPSHKGTEVLRAEIKLKISKLKQQISKEKKAKKSGFNIAIKRDGAAQIAICGLTNSGKSYLLSKLTNAKPTIASYEFTTKMPEMGILDYEGVKLQAIEIPAITRDFINKENGPTFFAIIRNANLVVFIIKENAEIKSLTEEFKKANIILNKKRPNITIKKEASGGINIIGTTKLSRAFIIEACKDFSIYNATIEFHEDVSSDEFKAMLNPATVFMPLLIIKNYFSEFDTKKIANDIWKKLDIIKVYTKTPGKEKDYPPIALKKDATIKALALIIHKDFIKKFKFARVWGSSMFPGQSLGFDYVLKDNDIVELHLK